jgi:hypothetical protein
VATPQPDVLGARWLLMPFCVLQRTACSEACNPVRCQLDSVDERGERSLSVHVTFDDVFVKGAVFGCKNPFLAHWSVAGCECQRRH